MPTENENFDELEGLYEPDEIESRSKDADRIKLEAGDSQTRIYDRHVRKVYCKCFTGKVKVIVKNIETGNTMSERAYSPGEYGGPEGGNGVDNWGPCIVEYKAVVNSFLYYHVEWI